MALLDFLKSSILSKFVMALTGIILLLFITGHMVGNLQVFMGRDTFNTYAQFLHSTGELLWVVRATLFISLVLHIITSIYLQFLNNSARPVEYKLRKYVQAKLNSRSMIWTGIMIFMFLVYHLMHFTVQVTDSDLYGKKEYYDRHAEYVVESEGGSIQSDGKSFQAVNGAEVVFERNDVYYMVIKGFQKPIASIAYIIGMIILGFHLTHAIQSAFQTLGISGPKFTPRLVAISNLVGILIVLGYISIPVLILSGIAGGGL